jgi:hypothetical protein
VSAHPFTNQSRVRPGVASARAACGRTQAADHLKCDLEIWPWTPTVRSTTWETEKSAAAAR